MATSQLRVETPAELSTESTGLPRALWFLAAAMLLIRSAEVFSVPIMPLYARLLDTGVPLIVIGRVTSIDRLGGVLISPFAGRWADAVGRRRPYIIGVGITANPPGPGRLAVEGVGRAA